MHGAVRPSWITGSEFDAGGCDLMRPDSSFVNGYRVPDHGASVAAYYTLVEKASRMSVVTGESVVGTPESAPKPSAGLGDEPVCGRSARCPSEACISVHGQWRRALGALADVDEIRIMVEGR
jgi:hypothetical protein